MKKIFLLVTIFFTTCNPITLTRTLPASENTSIPTVATTTGDAPASMAATSITTVGSLTPMSGDFHEYKINGQTSPITDCYIEPGGKGWAVSKDAAWIWDMNDWQQVLWPGEYQPSQVVLGFVSQNDVWAGSDAGLAHWNGQKWQKIASPLDTINRKNFTVRVRQFYVVSTQDIWVYSFILDNEGGSDLEAIVIHWDGKYWNKFEIPQAAKWYGYIMPLSKDWVWIGNWLWDGKQWQEKEKDSYIETKRGYFLSSLENIDNTWLMFESSEGGGNIASLYYWQDRQWEKTSEVMLNRKFYVADLKMNSEMKGWFLVDYEENGNDIYNLFVLEDKKWISYQLPVTKNGYGTICPIDNKSVFIFNIGSPINLIFHGDKE